MNENHFITAYPSGDEVPLQGNSIILENGELVVECMTSLTISLPSGDHINSFDMFCNDQPYVVLAEALARTGGDAPKLSRKTEVQDFLDVYDSVTWYSVPISRSNVLALLAAGYVLTPPAAEATAEFMPTSKEIADVKVLLDDFVKESLEAERIRYNEHNAEALKKYISESELSG